MVVGLDGDGLLLLRGQAGWETGGIVEVSARNAQTEFHFMDVENMSDKIISRPSSFSMKNGSCILQISLPGPDKTRLSLRIVELYMSEVI